MKNVVAYCRVSTDGQTGEGKFGIDAQKEQIMDYCSRNDMQISAWYIDEGVSGVKESRPMLDALLYGDIKNPPVDAVVVAKSDRIARDIKLYYYFMMLFEKKGMQLISATEEVVNDDTGLGNVYRSLMLFVAEQERKNITRRTSGGRAIKAARGGYSGGRPPYGYKPIGGVLTIVDSEAEVVRKIFEMKKDGSTYQQIVDCLNGMGKTNRSGSKFSISTVQVILGNENLYKGLYKYGKSEEWTNGVHDPII
jgi:DNA invertase Pin-like site-specific DNA recombinase